MLWKLAMQMFFYNDAEGNTECLECDYARFFRGPIGIYYLVASYLMKLRDLREDLKKLPIEMDDCYVMIKFQAETMPKPDYSILAGIGIVKEPLAVILLDIGAARAHIQSQGSIYTQPIHGNTTSPATVGPKARRKAGK
jgi:hypothetical protein